MKMKKRQATPREFGLRVRTHPEALLITARNKMASGRDIIVATHALSRMGLMRDELRLPMGSATAAARALIDAAMAHAGLDAHL